MPEPEVNERWDSWDTELVVFLYQREAVACKHTGEEVGRILQEAGFTAVDGRPLEISLLATAAGTPPEPAEGRMLEMDGGEAHVQWRLRAELSLVELWLSFSSESGDSSSPLSEERFTAETQNRLVKVFAELCCLPGFECGGNYFVSGEVDLKESFEDAFAKVIKDGEISLKQMTSSQTTMIWFPLFLGSRFVRILGREKLLQCPARPVVSPTEDVVCIYDVPFDPCLVLPDDGLRAGTGQRIREYLRKLVIESERQEQSK